jgi:hypothetical protein
VSPVLSSRRPTADASALLLTIALYEALCAPHVGGPLALAETESAEPPAALTAGARAAERTCCRLPKLALAHGC